MTRSTRFRLLPFFGLFAAACASGGDQGTPAAYVPLSTSTTAEAATRDPFRWPFDDTSPWNTPIGSDAEYARADDPTTLELRDPDITIWLNSTEWSHPIIESRPDDPVVTVGYETTATAPFGPGTVEIHLPRTARPAIGADAHLHVVESETAIAHEFFQMNIEGSQATAVYYVSTDLSGSGIETGGTRAYGGSALGGLIRTWEMDEGHIGHALAVALNGDQLQSGPVWPAVTEDAVADETYRGLIPMGTLMAIPDSVDIESLFLTEEGLVVARALQDYGAYVVDQSVAMTFYAEPDLPALTVARLRDDLQRLRRELRVVANNSPDTPGGGGTPAAPAPPALEVP